MEITKNHAESLPLSIDRKDGEEGAQNGHPTSSLADEMIRALLEENAGLREENSRNPTMTLEVVEQLGRENAQLRIKNAQLQRKNAQFQRENERLRQNQVGPLNQELLEAKAKIALLERRVRGAEKIIKDQAVRAESNHFGISFSNGFF